MDANPKTDPAAGTTREEPRRQPPRQREVVLPDVAEPDDDLDSDE